MGAEHREQAVIIMREGCVRWGLPYMLVSLERAAENLKSGSLAAEPRRGA